MIIQFITEGIYPAALVVFLFGLTIFVHEFGHFWVAKKRGMKIDRFSIGFGPKIFGWEKDGIEYRVSWFPFGGYVALPQMAPMEAIEGKSDTAPEDLPPASPTSKIYVALAGPFMNIVLAFLLACIIWIAGMPVNLAVVGSVPHGSPEEQQGILPGDRIVEVNGEAIKTWGQFLEIVAFSREPSVKVVLERAGQRHDYLLETKLHEKLGIKMLGIEPREHPMARKIQRDSAAEQAGLRPGDQFLAIEDAPIYSTDQLRSLIGKRADEPTAVTILRGGQKLTLTVVPKMNAEEKVGRMGVVLGEKYEIMRPGPNPFDQFADVFSSMWRMAAGLVHHKETKIGVHNLQGPVAILPAWWYEIVAGGILRGLVIAVMLNINLALLNLLPIPVLDGGHIVFSLAEALRRKPLNARFVQTTSMTFAAILISFMLYISVLNFQQWFLPSRAKTKPAAPEVAPHP